MDAMKVLAEIDHAMTEIDLALYDWQTAADMMSFIGQDIPMRVYEVESAQLERLTVKRIPLAKYENHERVIIGIADVNEKSGVIRAEVQEDQAEILAIGHQAEYHIVDEVPPIFDHKAIKAQLRALIAPGLYINPYVIPDEAYRLKMKYNGEWLNIEDVPTTFLDNHPFFKETPNAP